MHLTVWDLNELDGLPLINQRTVSERQPLERRTFFSAHLPSFESRSDILALFSDNVNQRVHPELPLSPTQVWVDIQNLYKSDSALALPLSEVEGFLHKLRRGQRRQFSKSVGKRLKADLELLFGGSKQMERALEKGGDLPGRVHVLLEIYRAALDAGTPFSERLEVFERYASNEAAARYIYEILMTGAYPDERNLVVAFIARNRFFKDAVSIADDPAILVTSSFEKEVAKDTFTDYFRPEEISDADWGRMRNQEKMDILRSRVNEAKKNGESVVHTAVAPDFIGGLGREMDVGKHAVFEFRKSAYAVTPLATKTQVGIVMKDLKETNGFHVHTAFELKDTPEEMKEFNTWKRDADEQAVLEGYEEGLFGGSFTGGEGFLSEVKLFTRISANSSFFDDKLGHTLASRERIYGEAKKKGYKKVGIEYRDGTHSKKTLDRWIDSLHSAVGQAIWRGSEARRASKELVLPTQTQVQQILFEAGIPRQVASRLTGIETSALLPFSDFRSHSVWDWKSKAWKSLSDEEIRTFAEGRDQFLQEMKNLAKNIQENETKTRRLESEDDIRAAIRWSVKDWAMKTKPSRLKKALP